MLKPVEWMGSSKADLKRFPDPVQGRLGFAIYRAQLGRRHRDAKPLKGFGSGVVEVVARHDGDTFRAVYTVRFETTVMSCTPSRRRPGGASRPRSPSSTWSAADCGPPSGTTVTRIVETDAMKPTDTAAERGSGNVFADLGFPDADAHLVKAELVSRIDDIVRGRGLTQTEAARLMGLVPTRRVAVAAGRLPRVFAGAPVPLAQRTRARHRHRHPKAAFHRRRPAAHRRCRTRLTLRFLWSGPVLQWKHGPGAWKARIGSATAPSSSRILVAWPPSRDRETKRDHERPACLGLRCAGLTPRLRGAKPCKRTLATALAPCRQMRAVQPLAAQQPSDLARSMTRSASSTIRSWYSAVN